MENPGESPGPPPMRKHHVVKRVAPLMMLSLLSTASYGIMAPVLPILMTQYYARKAAEDTTLDCKASVRDEVCVEGSKHAAWVSSVYSSIGSALLVFSSPLLGHASDVFGRKVFLVASQVLNLISTLAALYFTLSGNGISLYFVLSLLNGTDGVANAAVADLVGPANRAAAFGYVFATTVIGFIVGSAVTSLVSGVTCLYIALAVAVVRVTWSVFAFTESLPGELRSQDSLCAIGNPFAPLMILIRTKFYVLLTCIVALSTFVLTGLMQIQIFFFNVVLGFESKDLALLFLFAGLLTVLSQGVLLQPLIDRIRERGVLIVSCSNNVVTSLTFIFIAGYYPRKWFVFAMAPAGILSYLMLPTILALMSSKAAEKDQGRVQGAISGVRAVADALGSLAYGRLYATMDTKSTVSRMSPYILTTAIYLVGTVVAVVLPKSSEDKNDEWIISSRSRTESGGDIDMAFLPMPTSARCTELKQLDQVECL